MLFSAYVLIVIAAFSVFALSMFKRAINFSSLLRASTTLFAQMYGDNIRATFQTYEDSIFAVPYLVCVVIVMYSCVAQFYLAIFTIRYQTESKKTDQMIQRIKDQKEGEIKQQKMLIASKSKHFNEEVNLIVDYLNQKTKNVRGRVSTIRDSEDLQRAGSLRQGSQEDLWRTVRESEGLSPTKKPTLGDIEEEDSESLIEMEEDEKNNLPSLLKDQKKRKNLRKT